MSAVVARPKGLVRLIALLAPLAVSSPSLTPPPSPHLHSPARTRPADMSSCFGFRKSPDDDHRPLLPQYRDDTVLQRELHQKLHTYQMIRALTKGYMPSNEQVIVNLRSLLSAEVLNPDNPDLSDSGRLLVKYTKRWLHEFIEALGNKNSDDQIQDFIWYLSKARLSVDVDDIARRASKSKAKADVTAGPYFPI